MSDINTDPTRDERARTEAVTGNSRVITTVRSATTRVSRYVRSSFFYRWLTAEPDPEVVVIDLRETWTVGPILAVLDRVLSELSRGFESSRAGMAARTIATGTRSRPLAVFGMILAVLGSALVVRTLLATGIELIPTLAVGAVVIFTGTLLARDDRDWETLRETRGMKLLIRTLEPPTPPADGESEDDLNPNANDDVQTSDVDRPN